MKENKRVILYLCPNCYSRWFERFEIERVDKYCECPYCKYNFEVIE